MTVVFVIAMLAPEGRCLEWPKRMFKLSLSILIVCAFLPFADRAFAKDERSIRNLSKALAGLSSDVDPKEAELVAVTAHTTRASSHAIIT